MIATRLFDLTLTIFGLFSQEGEATMSKFTGREKQF